MKIAVTATSDTIDAKLDRRFGRTAWVILFDTETKDWQAVENTQNLQAAQGAGIQTAQTVVDSGADVVISGNVGPKAFRILQAANLDVYLSDAQTVQEAIAGFQAGTLKTIDAANVEGHWM
jgi:predicted Fe-Mo cluster-binding NifX family protein